MIRFIDINTGTVFDGSSPYTFWFDEGQSVNLNYIRKICCVATNSSLTIHCDSPVFKLIDISGIEQHITSQEVFDQQKYYNLNELTTNHIELDGTPYKGLFVYMFYFLGKSADGGEYTDTFTINDEIFNIGADFYNEDERLTVNLANRGVEIPYDVQKAIYEQNVHEEAQNNILLNRKYKELLLNYWDILANKGNYRSLIKSLDWFEYGDLLTIREFWNEPGTHYNYYDKIRTIVDDDILRRMQDYVKKTYMGIYFALKKTRLGENGEILYENHNSYVWVNETGNLQWATLKQLDGSPKAILDEPYNLERDRLLQIGECANVDDYEIPPVPIAPGMEDTDEGLKGSNWYLLDPDPTMVGTEGNQYILNELNPALDDLVALHSTTDMALKMTVLGNYYATFFMPVQMDLIHSTIEAVVYTACTKILHNENIARYDAVGDMHRMKVSVDCDARLRPIKDLFVYKDTLFGGTFGEIPVGVECVRDNEADDGEDYMSVTYRKWGGIGCVAHIRCVVQPRYNTQHVFVKREVMTISCGDYSKVLVDNKIYEPVVGVENPSILIGFDVLLHHAGDTVINLSFETNDGNTYVSSEHIDVRPYLSHDFVIGRVMPADNIDDFDTVADIYINNFVFGQKPLTGDYIYRQYINLDQDAGLNHVVMVYLEECAQSKLSDGENEVAITPGTDPSDCDAAFPGYRWLVREMYEYPEPMEQEPQPEPILIGHVLMGISRECWREGATEVHVVSALNGKRRKSTQTRRFRDEVLFLPALHRVEDAGDEYVFTQHDVLCVAPEIGDNISYAFEGAVWEFVNTSTGEVYSSEVGSVFEPFVAPYERGKLSRGYYDVRMRYKYSDEVYECKKSLFIVE